MNAWTPCVRNLLAWLLCGFICACENPQESGTVSGYIEAEYVYVAAPRPGWIVRQTLREGDRVEDGAMLFELDQDREDRQLEEAQARLVRSRELQEDAGQGARKEEIDLLEAQLQAARARLDLAAAERERWEKTAAQDLASHSQRDAAVAEHRAAQAELRVTEQRIRVARLPAREHQINAARAETEAATAAAAVAEWDLGQRAVRAGTAGIIDEIYFRTGEYVQPGTPVCSILLPDTRKARFYLPQARLSEIQLGATVEVRVDGNPHGLAARISHIASDAEFTPPVLYGREARDKLVFLVEADLEDSVTLHPGQPVDVILR
jgi:HlyD family secretion protein